MNIPRRSWSHGPSAGTKCAPLILLALTIYPSLISKIRSGEHTTTLESYNSSNLQTYSITLSPISSGAVRLSTS